MTGGIEAALSGVQAAGIQTQARANNIANLHTNQYDKERVLLSEQRPQGVGASVEKVASDGSYIAEITKDGYEFTEGSNVELSEEMSGMINTQHTYSANLKTIETAEEMTSTLLDIKA